MSPIHMPQPKWMTPTPPQRSTAPISAPCQQEQSHIPGWTANHREYSFLTPDPPEPAYTYKAHQEPLKNWLSISAQTTMSCLQMWPRWIVNNSWFCTRHRHLLTPTGMQLEPWELTILLPHRVRLKKSRAKTKPKEHRIFSKKQCSN